MAGNVQFFLIIICVLFNFLFVSSMYFVHQLTKNILLELIVSTLD